MYSPKTQSALLCQACCLHRVLTFSPLALCSCSVENSFDGDFGTSIGFAAGIAAGGKERVLLLNQSPLHREVNVRTEPASDASLRDDDTDVSFIQMQV